jgi:glutamine amidotransferase
VASKSSGKAEGIQTMNTAPIAIVDYGMGNCGSIKNMLKKIGVDAEITSEIKIIDNANKLILPGVGAFDNAMINLQNLQLINVLNRRVLEHEIPILGICLGAQLLSRRSDEGNLPGLGWIDAETIAFAKDIDVSKFKIPHMGWNTITINKDHEILKGLENDSRFYFVHSYYIKCSNSSDILTTSNYGIEFASSVQKDNVIGVQFHPEKSHKFGMQLLQNFTRL